MMREPAVGTLVATLLVAAASVSAADPQTKTKRDLTTLSLNELASLKVVSVSKKPMARGWTAAAIHVVTGEDLRRTGVTSLPDALRLVPGLHVARINSNQWAIGIRGFTSRLARSQLAVMDGRSLYTPLFAGTYWEVQDALLDDVDRIEVVRGPGGTLWGANAVNGIVNVMTKSAFDTQGGFVALGGGTEDRASVRVRYGGRIRETSAYRVYGKFFDRDAGHHADGSDFDAWRMQQAGFRTDWKLAEADALTVQGDAYYGRVGQSITFAAYEPPYARTLQRKAKVYGGNLSTRWTRSWASGSELVLGAYYDRASREQANFSEDRDTFDVDLQHRTRPLGRHQVVWGAGYRVSSGRSRGVETLRFEPPDRTDDLLHAFVEDDIELVRDRLRITVGTKAERNDYTGVELQPSLRLVFRPRSSQTAWAAFTRAVRTPSRIERDLSGTRSADPTRPVFIRLLGSAAFDTERMRAYEAGYRTDIGSHAWLETAVFHNWYGNLLSLEPEPPFLESARQIIPLRIANGYEGRISGGEISSTIEITHRCMVRFGYSYLNMQLRPRPGSSDRSQEAAEGASPRHRLLVRSALQLGRGLDLDLRYRWVDDLPTQKTPSFSSVDARLAWKARRDLELGLVGENLLRPYHLEFDGGSATPTGVQRSLRGEAVWRW